MGVKGFTLVEVLMVMLITVILTTALVTNFSRSRISVNQAALVVQDAIREAQSLALSGALWRGKYRCGYGINITEAGYIIFAGPDVQAGCAGDDFEFVQGEDDVVRTAPLPDLLLEISSDVDNIYFVPPNPRTYVNGVLADATWTVSVRKKGAQACPGVDCKQIGISPAGLVTLQTPDSQPNR
jgi:prepilin-type N-terminal cleavage/methylation domain-containing protein